MPFFQNENFRMHYEVVRGAVPSDTLLIHGNIASNLWWEPAVDRWLKLKEWEEDPSHPWRGILILAEWRGCGKSSGPSSEKEIDFSVLARDYLELLDSLGVHKANVVGHSAGGTIALHAMMQDPERFRRAVLLNPSPASGYVLKPEVHAKLVQIGQNRELAKEVLTRTIHQYDPTLPLFEKITDQVCSTHAVVRAYLLQKLAALDITGQLGQIKIPTLVLHGDQDPILTLEGSKAIAELLPEGRLQVLEHQGHSCNIENPDRFVAQAHRYLFG
jgi:pimeloyl-ACP methyl ester carboxylesterase